MSFCLKRFKPHVTLVPHVSLVARVSIVYLVAHVFLVPPREFCLTD